MLYNKINGHNEITRNKTVWNSLFDFCLQVELTLQSIFFSLLRWCKQKTFMSVMKEVNCFQSFINTGRDGQAGRTAWRSSHLRSNSTDGLLKVTTFTDWVKSLTLTLWCVCRMKIPGILFMAFVSAVWSSSAEMNEPSPTGNADQTATESGRPFYNQPSIPNFYGGYPRFPYSAYYHPYAYHPAVYPYYPIMRDASYCNHGLNSFVGPNPNAFRGFQIQRWVNCHLIRSRVYLNRFDLITESQIWILRIRQSRTRRSVMKRHWSSCRNWKRSTTKIVTARTASFCRALLPLHEFSWQWKHKPFSLSSVAFP